LISPEHFQISMCRTCHSEFPDKFCELILTLTFSRIEYTKAGEKKHHAYENTAYGPDFEPLAEIIIHRNIKPVIICESRGSMARDALKLKRIYEEKLSLFNASYL
jgi:deoxyribonuclease-4